MNDLIQNYTIGLPIQASTFAAQIDHSLNLLHIGMAVIFVLWGIFFTYCLIRFRRGRNPKAARVELGHASSFVPDAAVLIFELWLVFIFGLPIWAQVKTDFPKAQDSMEVELVAEQFAWNFHYAGPDGILGRRDPAQINSGNTLGLDLTDPAAKDDIISLNELHVPLGKPTIVYMTSKDVIHSFFVPEFRVKQDVVPGMRVPLWFEPTQAGTFELVCAQLCGLGHYRMKGTVIAHTPDEFAAKLKEIKAASMEGDAS
jgi:cytochrome c oxidase subunit 2